MCGSPIVVRLVLLLRAHPVASLELDLCGAGPTSEPPGPRIRPNYRPLGQLLHADNSYPPLYVYDHGLREAALK